mgnify:CR=1 FL=1
MKNAFDYVFMCIEGAGGSLFSNKKQPQKICFYLFYLEYSMNQFSSFTFHFSYNFLSSSISDI